MEERLGFLPEVQGHTFDILYDLLFTSERALALIVQHPADWPFQYGLKEMLFGGGVTRKLRRLEKKESPEERLARYAAMTEEELLAGHRFNFDIPYRLLRRVEVRQGRFQRGLFFQAEDPSALRGTIRFGLTKVQAAEAQALIARVFPDGNPARP